MIRLLIVDDSALMRRLLAELFQAEPDFEVAVARDGAEALRLLPEFRPDVVTLDVQMPGMDGLACLDRIMLDRPCPVVMVSALTQAGAEVTLAALERGAVDFVPKPGGAVSLAMEELAPQLLRKVRAAAGARLRRSWRLAERVRRRIRPQDAPPPAPLPAPAPISAPPAAAAPRAAERLVLVGCSTGGPPALDALLAPLPADFPWPILIAQHMPAAFTGPLAQRLDRLCALTVSEVARPVPLQPGHAYVGRGDADLILGRQAGGLVAMAAPADPGHPWHPSVDRLVRSALRHRPAARLVGVMLTGMGDDGAAAMAQLQAEGGITIAEAEETAVVWGMPGRLAQLGGATVVAPLPTIADQLLRWAA
ncbi:chemotaxis-specific protein-glutamate methyltransferase CheB [Siccirubricoccus sp. KC 17139]|uniref:Protein-glutamate methylesterase/protein-glutamine glutaminase n=1 Tax=Siccirubricoccus soli TaxID=2899147 RepID=A0ABT1DAR3_9PROT|nr:chemotaxis-specific protein-glutamate methyltransferase CheB [Siccirubricoccus soli]MCO6419013.1 chemotaxis-specific protein-glutamate methyltransferase CheB [Siccirubricoccus soli]MCP2685148.1 chemotaxis-specific protein-glutamate methyltransferase CheB [Siccirubricoccus soli]